MSAPIELHMVGDVRQAIINVEAKDPKHKPYKGVNIKNWFDLRAKRERLEISHAAATWRCSQTIATFADSIFGRGGASNPPLRETRTPLPTAAFSRSTPSMPKRTSKPMRSSVCATAAQAGSVPTYHS
jgi:hypothetical protein